MKSESKPFSFTIAALFAAGSTVIGSIGAIVTTPAIPTWYAALTKPSFTPPNWLFGPAWTILFILMGVSAYLIFREGTKWTDVRKALSVFGIQFALNVLWSFLFFAARSPGAGLAGIAALWTAILVTMVLFFRISRTAGWLLVPYLAWVTFASALNAAVFVLN